MDFKEWYNKHREYNYDAVYAPHESKIAWDACKKEILKLLNNYHVIPLNKNDVDVVEKIKRL